MPLTPGTRLGPYEILALLGEGGMGQVYKARDTRLGRSVAIKVVAEEFSNRFQSEARAISGLNHPNICTLYDVGPGYLVMELVEGETLASRLQQGRLPMDTVLCYGAAVAGALTAAHAKGIVHRDLKPGNLMVSTLHAAGGDGLTERDIGLRRREPFGTRLAESLRRRDRNHR
jgi:serine/threonine protein kinase